MAWGTFGVVALALLVLYNLYRETDVWYLWTGEPLKTKHAFNEAIRGSIFRTRANTWSNIGYIFVGIYTIAYAWWDARRPTKESDPYAVREPALMVLFGFACVVLGFGSGAMHAAMTGWGHKADVFGMFAVLIALVALQSARWFPAIKIAGKRHATWPALGLIAIILSLFLINNMNLLGGGAKVFGSLIIFTWITITVDTLRGKTSQQHRWLALSGISLATAYLIWNLDKAGRFSTPESWLQGHALWHLLTAVTLGSMAALYRSEISLAPVDTSAPRTKAPAETKCPESP